MTALQAFLTFCKWGRGQKITFLSFPSSFLLLAVFLLVTLFQTWKTRYNWYVFLIKNQKQYPVQLQIYFLEVCIDLNCERVYPFLTHSTDRSKKLTKLTFQYLKHAYMYMWPGFLHSIKSYRLILLILFSKTYWTDWHAPSEVIQFPICQTFQPSTNLWIIEEQKGKNKWVTARHVNQDVISCLLLKVVRRLQFRILNSELRIAFWMHGTRLWWTRF